MAELWFELRRDPIKFQNNRIILEDFLRKASFQEEDTYYVYLHQEYMR